MTPLLSTKDAAGVLGVDPAWLERQRARRLGPAYVDLGCCIRYRREDLEASVQAAAVLPKPSRSRDGRFAAAITRALAEELAGGQRRDDPPIPARLTAAFGSKEAAQAALGRAVLRAFAIETPDGPARLETIAEDGAGRERIVTSLAARLREGWGDAKVATNLLRTFAAVDALVRPRAGEILEALINAHPNAPARILRHEIQRVPGVLKGTCPRRDGTEAAFEYEPATGRWSSSDAAPWGYGGGFAGLVAHLSAMRSGKAVAPAEALAAILALVGQDALLCVPRPAWPA